MSDHLDQAARIAEHLRESGIHDVAGGAPLSAPHILAEIEVRFPTASIDDISRGVSITDTLLRADRAERGHVDMVNNPCACGAPGAVVLLDEHGHATGERQCFECDLAEAGTVACVRCGGPMIPEDVRAGITLCEPCDPDEIGWIVDEEVSR